MILWKLLLANMALGLAMAFVPATAQSLINDAPNIKTLNDGNLNPVLYELPLPSADAVEFDFKLRGSVLGLPLIRARYTGWLDEDTYAAYSQMKTSGLAALLQKLEIWAVSTGHYSRAGLSPQFHIQQNRDKKNRRVEMVYDDAARTVDATIVPRLGSQGVPPASPAERYAADDTVTAILQLMMRGQKLDAPLCAGGLRVFDSKQHYNLRMVKAGTRRLRFQGKSVETIRCRVYYEPISGFDPEDLPNDEEESAPITVYLMTSDALGLHVPIRFTYKIRILSAVIKLTELDIRAPATSAP